MQRELYVKYFKNGGSIEKEFQSDPTVKKTLREYGWIPKSEKQMPKGFTKIDPPKLSIQELEEMLNAAKKEAAKDDVILTEQKDAKEEKVINKQPKFPSTTKKV